MYNPKPESNNAVEGANTLSNQIKTIAKPNGKAPTRAKIGRLEGFNYGHTDDDGNSWEQGY